MVAKNILNPNRLPPTIGAATEHMLKAYLQYNIWVILNAESLNLLDYGWKLAPGVTYEPVATKAIIAPESILDMFCRYGTALFDFKMFMQKIWLQFSTPLWTMPLRKLYNS